MWRGAAILLLLATAVRAAPATTQSTTQLSTQPTASISTAIASLLQEYAAPSLRAKADYFIEHPPAPPPDAIAAALSRSLARDPSQDAYVKWQLLGAMPEKVEGKVAARLIEAYHAAPALQARPGLELRDKQKLDRLVQRAKREQSVDLQEQLKTEVDRIEVVNAFALAYRDDLYRRLPASYDALAAGFADARQRCSAGIDPKPLIKQLVADTTAWAAADATGQELAAMARFLTELSQTPPTEYYDAVEWSTTGGAGHLRWKKKRLNLNDRKQLDDVVDFGANSGAAHPDRVLELEKRIRKWA